MGGGGGEWWSIFQLLKREKYTDTSAVLTPRSEPAWWVPQRGRNLSPYQLVVLSVVGNIDAAGIYYLWPIVNHFGSIVDNNYLEGGGGKSQGACLHGHCRREAEDRLHPHHAGYLLAVEDKTMPNYWAIRKAVFAWYCYVRAEPNPDNPGNERDRFGAGIGRDATLLSQT